MVEIYGGHMSQFFEKPGFTGICTYRNTDKYGVVREVWEISESVLETMSEMSEEEFCAIAGECAWWRYSEGSNLGVPYGKFIINHHRVKGWEQRNEYGRYKARCNYDSLLDYFCNHIGASQPGNVCALAVSMAKYNGMKMGELFSRLQP